MIFFIDLGLSKGDLNCGVAALPRW